MVYILSKDTFFFIYNLSELETSLLLTLLFERILPLIGNFEENLRKKELFILEI